MNFHATFVAWSITISERRAFLSFPLRAKQYRNVIPRSRFKWLAYVAAAYRKTIENSWKNFVPEMNVQLVD